MKKAKLNELVGAISTATGQRIVSINKDRPEKMVIINDLIIALNKSLRDKNNDLQKEDFEKIYTRITQIADNTGLQKFPLMTRIRHTFRSFFGSLSFDRKHKLTRIRQKILSSPSKSKQASSAVISKLAAAKPLKTEHADVRLISQKTLNISNYVAKMPVEAFSMPKAAPIVFNWLAEHQNEQFDLKVKPPLKIWMTTNAGLTGGERTVYIQIQNAKSPAKLQECILTLDNSNRILSTNKIGDLSDSDWEKHLKSGFENFMKTKGVKVSLQQLHIHPTLVSEHPEYVLQILYKNGNFQLPHFGVDFLSDELRSGSAWDRGGLSKQLISNLADALVKATGIKDGFPLLKDEEEKHVFVSLGRMFSACFNSEFKLGEHLPPAYFDVLKKMITEKTSLQGRAYSDLEMLNKARDLLGAERPDVATWEAYSLNNYQITDAIREQAGTMYYDDPQEYIDELKGDILIECKHVIKAMEAVMEGLSRECQKAFINQSAGEVSAAIQGNFSTEGMIAALECNSQDAVMQQKVTWLKEKIQQDPQWAKCLLFVMTSASTLGPDTKLVIKEAADELCHAHTCFNRLDLPLQHVDKGTGVEARKDLAQRPPAERDKALFFNNLALLVPNDLESLKHIGFDAA